MCLCVTILQKSWLVMRDSVYVYLMRGEYDDRLVWPFHGDITVQLVNQIKDQKHEEYTFTFDDKSLISSCSRVTSGERAKSGCVQSLALHCYKDDCDSVRFRVTKVVIWHRNVM